MDLKVDIDPRVVLENMQIVAKRVKQKLSTKPSRSKIYDSGKYYFSFFCRVLASTEKQIRNGFQMPDEALPSVDSLVKVHYPPSEPEYFGGDVFDVNNLADMLRSAEKNAFESLGTYRTAGKRKPRFPIVYPTTKLNGGIYEVGHIIEPFEPYHSKEIDRIMRELSDLMLEKDAGLFNREIETSIISGFEVFYDSRGLSIIQNIGRVYVRFKAYRKAIFTSGRILQMSDSIGGFGGFDVIRRLYEDRVLDKKAIGLVEKVKAFSRSEGNPGGLKFRPKASYPCVLSGSMVGMLIHEAIGHASEGDAKHETDSADPFENNEGVKLSPCNDLTIIDQPNYKLNGHRPLSYYEFDVEGQKAKRTEIFRNGVYKGGLHGTHSLSALLGKSGKGELGGNGRIGGTIENGDGDEEEQDGVRPSARMSTVVVLPKRNGPSLQEMLYSIRGKGFFLKNTSKASFERDDTGTLIPQEEVYFVGSDYDGVRGLYPFIPRDINMVRELFVKADTLNTLENIKMIGNKGTMEESPGYCVAESGTIAQVCVCPAALVNLQLLADNVEERDYPGLFDVDEFL